MKVLNTLTPPPPTLSRGVSWRLAITLTAVAMAMAAPVAAQTTGTIQYFGGGDFTFTPTVTLNSNREWEVNYSANLNAAIEALITNCKGDSTIPDKSVCFADLPYFMDYGVWRNGQSDCVFSATTSFPRLTIKHGINGKIPFTSWSQTLRTDPDTQYCIAMYASNPESIAYNLPITRAWFKTPADPNPPVSSWMPHPSNTGCGTETTLALVRQCFQCKGGGGSWSMSANTCGN